MGFNGEKHDGTMVIFHGELRIFFLDWWDNLVVSENGEHYPNNGQFLTENPIKIDDFRGTLILGYLHIL